jgi:hypothetical protein
MQQTTSVQHGDCLLPLLRFPRSHQRCLGKIMVNNLVESFVHRTTVHRLTNNVIYKVGKELGGMQPPRLGVTNTMRLCHLKPKRSIFKRGM